MGFILLWFATIAFGRCEATSMDLGYWRRVVVGPWQLNDGGDSEAKKVKGPLPEGFFDDKDDDLRARGIAPVKPDGRCQRLVILPVAEQIQDPTFLWAGYHLNTSA
ncbi:Coiled-coil domain-containing protein 16 [Forsythia ovata]|uniref:Coiled-coil domain-containing protein 16 n=1 Tax=Forsythia ovata TaxID=205694 RepID=A0ABD1VDL5_9LAMI